MKNYLVKNGELDLHKLIERESDKLNVNEFLNIDAIFETVLNKILLVPIKGHLYHLMVRENTRNGQLQRLSENLSLIRSMDPIELGFTPNTIMPDSNAMEQIRCYLRKMQNHYSPLKKLENLLKALSIAISRSLINNSGGDNLGTLNSLGNRTTCSEGANDLINENQMVLNRQYYNNQNDNLSLDRLPYLKNNSNDTNLNFLSISKQLPGEGNLFICFILN